MMKLENGIYEKEVGGIKVMINVTDKITMTFKKGDSVNVVPLNGLEVSELFEDWRDHRRENISAEHTVKVKTLQERNQYLYEKMFDQVIALSLVSNGLSAILDDEQNNISGKSKQLIKDIQKAVQEEITD